MMAWLMGLTSISPPDLQQCLARHDAILVVDVNARASWLASRVPGAVHLDPLAFEARDLPADRRAPLVFYCSNPFCRKAPSAERRARQMGFTDVRVMSAGIAGWLDAGLPTESGAPGSAAPPPSPSVLSAPRTSPSRPS